MQQVQSNAMHVKSIMCFSTSGRLCDQCSVSSGESLLMTPALSHNYVNVHRHMRHSTAVFVQAAAASAAQLHAP